MCACGGVCLCMCGCRRASYEHRAAAFFFLPRTYRRTQTSQHSTETIPDRFTASPEEHLEPVLVGIFSQSAASPHPGSHIDKLNRLQNYSQSNHSRDFADGETK